MRSVEEKAQEVEAQGTWRWLLAAALGCLAIGAVGAAMMGANESPESPRREESSERVSPSNNQDAAPDNAGPSSGEKFAVVIRRPSGPPRVATGRKDMHGNDITTSCSTCHSTRKPNLKNRFPADLDEFHVGMKFSHGKISCLSCHNKDDYDSLKLADGSRVSYANVMTLCGQCHGPQMKAYEHGAHGGMTGYWDLSRGGRQKNNCIDCHNPHTPQFPKMRPTFKPQDRFLEKPRAEH